MWPIETNILTDLNNKSLNVHTDDTSKAVTHHDNTTQYTVNTYNYAHLDA